MSYSAWSGGKTNYEATPQKIDGSATTLAPPQTGGSAWNAAGTFETRDLSSWTHVELTTRLTGLVASGGQVRSVESVSGDASINFVRGKKRSGYDVDFTLKVGAEGAEGDEEATTTIRVFGASADDLDGMGWEVTGKREWGDAMRPIVLGILEQLAIDLHEK